MSVFLGYPVAIAAIPIVAVVGALLAQSETSRRARWAVGGAAWLTVALCATVFWPGVVDPADLDVRAINAPAGAGVVLAAVLTGYGFARRGIVVPGRAAFKRRWKRLAIAACLVVAALPWVAATLGLFADEFRLLGRVFMASQPRPEPGAPNLPAVHLGQHHGMDGVLLALTALALSPAPSTVRHARLRAAVSAYLALMLAYGVAVALEDFWLEQVFKRGWTSWNLPNVLSPSAAPAWAMIIVAATALHVWVFRTPRSRGRPVLAGALLVAAVAGYVALGERKRVVPDVSGLPLKGAYRALERAEIAPLILWPGEGPAPPGARVCVQNPERGARSNLVVLVVERSCTPSSAFVRGHRFWPPAPEESRPLSA